MKTIVEKWFKEKNGDVLKAIKAYDFPIFPKEHSTEFIHEGETLTVTRVTIDGDIVYVRVG